MFVEEDARVGAAKRLLLAPRDDDAAAPAALAADDAPDLDAILREVRDAEALDDDDEEPLADEAAPLRRRARAPRAGVAGILDSLQMSSLGKDATFGGGGGGGGGSSGALALLSFTSLPLRPAFAADAESEFLEAPLWGLAPSGRALLLHRAAVVRAAAAEAAYAAALPAFREAAAAEAAARAAFDAAAALEAVRGSGVVGMTRNGAAKYSALLAALAPQVVIVEEAAEVKEPLLVAALPSRTWPVETTLRPPGPAPSTSTRLYSRRNTWCEACEV
jgi:hypothetical protein